MAAIGWPLTLPLWASSAANGAVMPCAGRGARNAGLGRAQGEPWRRAIQRPEPATSHPRTALSHARVMDVGPATFGGTQDQRNPGASRAVARKSSLPRPGEGRHMVGAGACARGGERHGRPRKNAKPEQAPSSNPEAFKRSGPAPCGAWPDGRVAARRRRDSAAGLRPFPESRGEYFAAGRSNQSPQRSDTRCSCVCARR
jgi:hypothetical protein